MSRKTKKEMLERILSWAGSCPDAGSITAVYGYLFPCPHERFAQDDDLRVCTECEASFGWWCTRSPDHSCYYFSDEESVGGTLQQVVRLSTGQRFVLPADHDSTLETSDFCLFCHEPDERK